MAQAKGGDDNIAGVEGIDSVLGDYSRQRVIDPTGMDELLPLMVGAKAIMDCAKLAGFNDAQAFKMALTFFSETFRMTAVQEA